MTIKEIWIPKLDDFENVTGYDEASVIFLSKKPMFAEGRQVGEIATAISYLVATGKIVEVPLEECVIKTLTDDKTKELVHFGEPRAEHRQRQEGR